MKVAAAILTAGLAILLPGCVVGGKPKTVQAAAPAPPKPVTPPPPAPPPPQLSIPQTHAELPPPQPITNEALATTQPPEEPAPAPVAPKPPRTRPAATRGNAEPPAQPPAAVGPPAENTAAERPPVGELVSDDEKRQLLADMQRARQDARRLLDRASAHRLSRPHQQMKQSVEQFLQLSLDAEKRGDLRQAHELAGRAAVLAKELQQ